MASKDEYKDDQEKLTKDASTLAVIALALGLHDQPNKYQARAGADQGGPGGGRNQGLRVGQEGRRPRGARPPTMPARSRRP